MKNRSFTVMFHEDQNGNNSPTGVMGDYVHGKGIELAPELMQKYSELKEIEKNISEIKQKVQEKLYKEKSIKTEFDKYRIHNISFDTTLNWFEIEIVNKERFVYRFFLDKKLNLSEFDDYIYNVNSNEHRFLNETKED